MENVLKAIEEMSNKFNALKEDVDDLKRYRERSSGDWTNQDPGHQHSAPFVKLHLDLQAQRA